MGKYSEFSALTAEKLLALHRMPKLTGYSLLPGKSFVACCRKSSRWRALIVFPGPLALLAR